MQKFLGSLVVRAILLWLQQKDQLLLKNSIAVRVLGIIFWNYIKTHCSCTMCKNCGVLRCRSQQQIIYKKALEQGHCVCCLCFYLVFCFHSWKSGAGWRDMVQVGIRDHGPVGAHPWTTWEDDMEWYNSPNAIVGAQIFLTAGAPPGQVAWWLDGVTLCPFTRAKAVEGGDVVNQWTLDEVY